MVGCITAGRKYGVFWEMFLHEMEVRITKEDHRCLEIFEARLQSLYVLIVNFICVLPPICLGSRWPVESSALHMHTYIVCSHDYYPCGLAGGNTENYETDGMQLTLKLLLDHQRACSRGFHILQ